MPHFGKALDLGLDLLEALQKAGEPLSFKELQDQVAIAPASYARFLKLLCNRGYIHQDQDGHYSVGWRAVELGLAGLSQNSIQTISRPHLEALTRATGESSELAVFDRSDFLFLDRIESSRSIVLAAKPGSRFGISDHTAIGWLGIAWDYPFTGKKPAAKTITQIRKAGYAGKLQNNGEVFRGAAAIHNYSGSCIGALCIAAPAFRTGKKEKKQFQELLIKHAGEISRALGFK